MSRRLLAALPLLCFSLLIAQPAAPPKAGPVQIMKSSDLKPGMKATAWTVFEGSQPEAVPVEIIGLWKNAWGPKQDIILGKMGGKAQRTGVAGGMSGSPVYVDGKLIGAVALRISVFSPDAICGITPIDLMLEINEIDKSTPPDPKAPGKGVAPRAQLELPNQFANVALGGTMVPIETPLTFSGFHEAALNEFAPMLRQMGIHPVLGGAAGDTADSKLAKNWASALQPGQPVAGVLVNGDMSVTGLGTVTYNDGKRVLAFGHPFFNLGPVNMPMSAGEILMVLSSQFTPNKFGNATDLVGALKQDRHSGIMGVLGESAEMIPVSVKVREGEMKREGAAAKTKDFKFNVFVNQKWTPFLMMLTLFNTLSGTNDFSEDITYRLSGKVEMEGQPPIALNNMVAPSDMPVPAPLMLVGWYGDKFNRLFGNPIQGPKVKGVNLTVDLLPQRRIVTVEGGWLSKTEVAAGDTLKVRAFLRPYRGERFEHEFQLKVPEGLTKGEHRIVISDSELMNRYIQMSVQSNRLLDLGETVSLLNQEQANNQVFVSLLQQKTTVYVDDKTLPSLPNSVLNVMQSSRGAARTLGASPESVVAQASAPLDYVVSGNYSLRLLVR